MAVPIAVTVAAMLPWKEIIKHLPEVARSAKELWRHWHSRSKEIPIDPAAPITIQIAAAVERIQSLESNEAKQAEVMSLIADQLQGVANGLRETVARQIRIQFMVTAALVLSVSALIISLQK